MDAWFLGTHWRGDECDVQVLGSKLGWCVGRIGRVEGNIFNQSANDRLGKFQSVTNPSIYESGTSVKNLNGFNLAGLAVWAGWKIQEKITFYHPKLYFILHYILNFLKYLNI